MHFHTNHMWCQKNNWDGGYYDSRFMVSIERYMGRYPNSIETVDWSLVDRIEYPSGREILQGYTSRLRPGVFSWLVSEVKDTKDGKGFCVGNDEYNSISPISFNIFFQRRSDAMKFIKRWSIYKKPTTYYDHFRGIRKELDLKTGNLKAVDEFTLI